MNKIKFDVIVIFSILQLFRFRSSEYNLELYIYAVLFTVKSRYLQCLCTCRFHSIQNKFQFIVRLNPYCHVCFFVSSPGTIFVTETFY